MALGIEKMDIYAGRARLPIDDLAKARGADPAYVRDGLMALERGVFPAFEDTVTLAVNAAKRLLSPADIKDIGMLVVGTESSLDQAKSTSTWVHRFLELPSNCRNFEVKHACYAGVAALKTALFWVASGERPGKKALVICSDTSRGPTVFAHDPNAEFITGGAAVAMLVSDQPKLLSIDLKTCGVWSTDIADYFRPLPATETFDAQLSLLSYLDALDGSFADYMRNGGNQDFLTHFQHHVYHAPFPGMTRKAHRSMMTRKGKVADDVFKESFAQRVAPGLAFNQCTGTTFGGSVFVSLLGHLNSGRVKDGDHISLFSYGSGCHGEFIDLVAAPDATAQTKARNIAPHFATRQVVNTATYELFEDERAQMIGVANFTPTRSLQHAVFKDAYEGRALLILENIENYRRAYRWS